MMNLFYGDDSEICNIKSLPVPNIFMYGGILISGVSAAKIKAELEDIKIDKIGVKRAPIKWNYREQKIRSSYIKHFSKKIIDNYFTNMPEIRRAFFEVIKNNECSLFFSIIESKGKSKKVLSYLKVKMQRYAFSNCLMRIGLEANIEVSTELILDWPSANNPEIYNPEYAAGYNSGKSHLTGVKYICGPLRNRNFVDSLYYTNMLYSTILQLADMSVGLIRTYLDNVIKNKENDFISSLFEIIRPKFYGYPNFYGRGLSVSSSSPSISKILKNHFNA